MIGYRAKRYGCPYCAGGPPTTHALSWHVPPWPLRRAYEEYRLKALLHRPVQAVRQKEGVGYHAVLGVLERRVANRVAWSALTYWGAVGSAISCYWSVHGRRMDTSP